MAKQTTPMHTDVTGYLESLDHPLQKEIAKLRQYILGANAALTENIKWNGPNFCFRGADRITMRIHPPKQIQLIFHRGAAVLAQPKEKLIDDESGMLTWKTNDRAVVTYKSMEDIQANKSILTNLVNKWIEAADR